MDEKWYDTVVRACGLQKDLEQMPRGDGTLVGDDGGILSGGQRQRVVSMMHRPIYGILTNMFITVFSARCLFALWFHSAGRYF